MSCAENTISFFQGARLFELKVHKDHRGELAALEQGCNLQFALKRVFYLKVESAQVTRAEHACSAHQVIVPLIGSVIVDLNNGVEQRTLCLGSEHDALWVYPGVWLRLRMFQPITVLLIAASRLFHDTKYYENPQPDLVSSTGPQE